MAMPPLPNLKMSEEQVNKMIDRLPEETWSKYGIIALLVEKLMLEERIAKEAGISIDELRSLVGSGKKVRDILAGNRQSVLPALPAMRVAENATPAKRRIRIDGFAAVAGRPAPPPHPTPYSEALC